MAQQAGLGEHVTHVFEGYVSPRQNSAPDRVETVSNVVTKDNVSTNNAGFRRHTFPPIIEHQNIFTVSNRAT